MRFFAVLCAAAACVSAQPARLGGLSPELLTLLQIRQRMLANLDRQPDYTCHETIERSRRAGPSRPFEPRDTLRLEVALIDGTEMFGWPGENGFDETDPRDIVADGAMGNGDFALHARAIFENASAVFTFRGLSAGLLKYDFRVPRELSRYQLRVGSQQAFVGYGGSILADAATLDIQSIEIAADGIPPALGLSQTLDRMEYATQRIGSGDFLLPASSELIMADRGGGANRNRVVFDGCREFKGEVSVSFNPNPSRIAPAAPNPKQIDLPSGMGLTLRLSDNVDTKDAAIGDPVRARLENDLKRGGYLLFAKGSMVLCRITRIERLQNYTLLGLEFSEIKTQGAWARLHASFERIAGEEFLLPLVRVSAPRPRPGEAIIPVRSGPYRLTHGILMFWRTGS
ncbi:MAG: hypothetical protein ACRD30_07705 [Bryobacteraceae bacterium]